MRLTIDLIPRPSFFTNLRSELGGDEWDTVRKLVYQRAGYRCEICGGKGDKHPVEAHEVWEYKGGVQKLVRITALCPNCHEVKHYGLALVKGNDSRARDHLMKINGWSHEEVWEHINEAFDTWRERNNVEWELDISVVTDWIHSSHETNS